MGENDPTSARVMNTGPHHIRITDSGKIKAWVAFALSFLEENEDRPIVFHTLPAKAKIDKDGNAIPETKPSSSKAKPTLAVPRLLSVVEIVKREFIKSLEAKHSPRLAGLHQYNEIGCLEQPDASTEGDRAAEIARALSGTNHVKQKQTPYMKITLSNTAMPELVDQGATYQPPMLRKLTKSAKMRMKKRARAAKQALSANDDDTVDMVPD
ncbi:hypothetical protein H0H81_011532 [Sphagnurus paluster]|uniref:Uncharacterized protein n=1 Tax=Sphagnurus paluster TaxID=117069 RepID=A0A9P7GNN7_9AGAR|nr:hypothetical protein H0H81_011532 [Sphagnurus paluster]